MLSARLLALVTLLSGAVGAAGAQTTAPTLTGDQVVERAAPAVVLILAGSGDGRVSAIRSAPVPDRPTQAERSTPADPNNVLRTCRTIFVESHTIYLKGNLLQDALYTRPEIREWGIRIVDDRAAAEVYIDVTRPFLTFDWVYKMIDTRTGTVLATGKVVAWDGPIAAPQLAGEIVGRIRGVRPLPPAGKQPPG